MFSQFWIHIFFICLLSVAVLLKREQMLQPFLQVLEIFGCCVKTDYVTKKCTRPYLIAGSYGHLDIAEENVQFKSVQQQFHNQEKWYLQKHMVLPYFHSDMSNSIVYIEREEDGEKQIYLAIGQNMKNAGILDFKRVFEFRILLT